MKKALIYIMCGVLICAVVIYLFSLRTSDKKEISTYISLNKKDKNPYGAFVFHECLKKFFPKAAFKINYSPPGDVKIFGDNKPDQLYVILQPEFQPNSYEVDDLITFIDRGNNIFISTFYISSELYRFLNARVQTKNYTYFPYGSYDSDTMNVRLSAPPFVEKTDYRYPGISIESYFKDTDSSISKIIGYADDGAPNFIHLKKGNGNLYIHLSPMSFSNYFLLYNDNIQYFEKVFSQFPTGTPLVIWDEYFRTPHSRSGDRGWFNAVMKNPYFRAGVLTALVLLLVYALTEMRRKQRVIPIMEKPANDSLEFVKTMGLLYYERGDHTNLAQKMSAYFLEHVRSRYKIFAKKLDSGFVNELSYKSGVSKTLVENIVIQINRINNEGVFTDTELIALQNNMDEFYNKE
ncbi:DUF4350 domain-containing protein [Niabella ginsengisoli]|uniref:DUF4350 domain-containing protein n=1 Tax=Niabella ginsengisoli TaxID=522298 RepID=A0ABS9SMT2_9BACT|nr:DUF4350 domain-containing protein [Niabella ginsengisoli]MCH5599571.1 hypothetical protein [Niabella ginsengisoli]